MKPPPRIDRVLIAAMRRFREDDGVNRAAAISFYSLLSLGPLLYLIALAIHWAYPDVDAVQLAISRSASILPAEAHPLLEAVGTSLPRRGKLVLIALPGLLWAASAGASSLEHAINVAFGTVHQRRFWLSRVKSLVIVLIGVALLLLSLSAHQLLSWLDRSRVGADLPPLLEGIQSWWIYGTLFLVPWAALTFLFKVLPRGRVSWRAAGVAAAPTVLALELMRGLFGFAVGRFKSYELLTGTVAGGVALLLWLYGAAAITVLGAELAAILNGHREQGGSPGPAA